ncbi:MAG: carboxymuconolactone decarboxylase family protein [Gemmatimonadota bacterium]
MSEPEARAIARAAAAAAGGDDELLRAALPDLLAHVAPSEVEELLLQTYLFAGFPRAINAFFAWQGWAVARGLQRDLSPVEAYEPAHWRARGELLCRLVYGAGFAALQQRLARLHPALAEWTLVEGYGKVLSRPGPDFARRELAAVGALVALGAERQLASHLRGAVNAGVPRPLVASAARAAAAEWDRASLVERHLSLLEA